jgi:tetratricopeptide (TPR) repeat protein
MNQTHSAIELAQEGADIYDRLGHSLRGANGRYALGLALAQAGQLAEAADRLGQALDVFRDSRQRLWEGMTLFRIAEVRMAEGHLAEAAALAEQSLTVLRGIGGEWRRGNVLTVLGRALAGIGQPGRAQVCWRDALRIYEELGSSEAEEVRRLLSPLRAA